MSCSVCACTRFSQHVWRKNKCNECFHAVNLHAGVTIGDDGQIYVDGILSTPLSAVTSPSKGMSAADAAQVVSPVQNRQHAFGGASYQASTPAHASTPAKQDHSSEKVNMVTSAPASTPGRKFAAPGSKAQASPVGPATGTLSIPSNLDHSTPTKSGSRPGSKPGSKPGSRRGSVTKQTIPGMVAEEKPYAVKALYSHTGSIPEQLSFKRGEILEIDGHMEGWLSATVIENQERRGWIPSNYVEKLPEGTVELKGKKSKSRRGSAMVPASNGSSNGHRGSVSVNAHATSTTALPVHSPGPAVNEMSSSHVGVDSASSAAQSTIGQAVILLEALYDYVAEFPEQQLSFQKGDVFVLLNRDDQDWWDVKNSETGAVGAVPALYMRELNHVDSQMKEELASDVVLEQPAATAAAVAEEPKKAEPVADTPARRAIVLPAVSVSSNDTAAASVPTSAPTVVSSIPAEATHRAAYSFTATAAGQLSYAKGDFFRLLAEEHPGWWRFSHFVSGQQGLVAVNYITVVTPEERAAAATVETQTPAAAAAEALAKQQAAAAAESARLAELQRQEDELVAKQAELDAQAKALEAQRIAEAAAAAEKEAQRIREESERQQEQARKAAEEAAAIQRAAELAEEQRLKEKQEQERQAALQREQEAAERKRAEEKLKQEEEQARIKKQQEEHEAAAKAAAEAEALRKVQEEQAAAEAARVAEEQAAAEAARVTAAAAQPPVASAASNPVHRALYDFAATAAGQVSFSRDELLEVLDATGGHGWWSVRNTKGEQGMAPQNYINETPEATAAPVPVTTTESVTPAASTAPTGPRASFIAPKRASVVGAGASTSAVTEPTTTQPIAEEPATSVTATAPTETPSTTLTETARHKALFDFSATAAGQVSLTKDDIIDVHEKGEHGWWTVTNSAGEKGMAPANYINPTAEPAASEPVVATEATPSSTPSGPRASFIAPKRASVVSSDPLLPSRVSVSTASPQHTPAASPIDGTSSQGLDAQGQPLRIFDPQASPSVSAAATPAATTSTEPTQEAVALYAFTATAAGQISFAKDDVLSVVAPPASGWFLARKADGEQGNVPENYFTIRPVGSATAAVTATPSEQEKTAITLTTPSQTTTVSVSEPASVSQSSVDSPSSGRTFVPSSTPLSNRRGTVMTPSSRAGPPPVPQHLQEHMKRHSLISTSSVQGASLLAQAKPLTPLGASKGGPPPLSKDMQEHVKRLSLSHAAGTNLLAGSPMAAASTPTAGTPLAAAKDIPHDATHRAAYNYTAAATGQLSYAKGDFLALISQDHPGWWRFKHHASALIGLIASNYVKPIPDDEIAAAKAKYAAAQAEAASAAVTAEPTQTPSARSAAPSVVESIAEEPEHESPAQSSAVASQAHVEAAPAAAVVETASSSAVSRHKVLFDFSATVGGQVSLTKDDIIEVHEKGEHGWWTVTNSAGERGMAPANYLNPTPESGVSASLAGASTGSARSSLSVPQTDLTAPTPKTASTVSVASDAPAVSAPGAGDATGSSSTSDVEYEVVALYDYAAQSADQLSTSRGQKLTVLGASHTDWVSTRSVDGSTGIVPLAYCARILGRVRSLYQFARDETKNTLGFEPGQIIRVTNRNEESSWGTGWMEDSQSTGLFPLNYVENI